MYNNLNIIVIIYLYSVTFKLVLGFSTVNITREPVRSELDKAEYIRFLKKKLVNAVHGRHKTHEIKGPTEN